VLLSSCVLLLLPCMVLIHYGQDIFDAGELPCIASELLLAERDIYNSAASQQLCHLHILKGITGQLAPASI
jgi:hypothetical protein